MSSSRIYWHKRKLRFESKCLKRLTVLDNVFLLNWIATGICGNNLSVCRKTTHIHKQKRPLDNKRQNYRESATVGYRAPLHSTNFVPVQVNHMNSWHENFVIRGKKFTRPFLLSVTPLHHQSRTKTSRHMITLKYFTSFICCSSSCSCRRFSNSSTICFSITLLASSTLFITSASISSFLFASCSSTLLATSSSTLFCVSSSMIIFSFSVARLKGKKKIISF